MLESPIVYEPVLFTNYSVRTLTPKKATGLRAPKHSAKHLPFVGYRLKGWGVKLQDIALNPEP